MYFQSKISTVFINPIIHCVWTQFTNSSFQCIYWSHNLYRILGKYIDINFRIRVDLREIFLLYNILEGQIWFSVLGINLMTSNLLAFNFFSHYVLVFLPVEQLLPCTCKTGLICSGIMSRDMDIIQCRRHLCIAVLYQIDLER